MYYLLFCIVAAEDGYSMSIHGGTLLILAVVAAVGVVQENPLTVVPRLGATAGIVLSFSYLHTRGAVATGDIWIAAIIGLRHGFWGGVAAVGIGAALTLIAVHLLAYRRKTETVPYRVPAIPGFLCGELIVGGIGPL